MSSRFETGHAINVANFSQLVNLIPTLGISYTPTRAELMLPSLAAHLALAELSIASVTEKAEQFNTKAKERERTFATLPKFATKVINALKVSLAPASMIKSAQAINKKIRGERARMAPAPDSPDELPAGDPTTGPDTAPSTKAISVSQRSYDSLAQHFHRLVKLASTHPGYAPAESEFTITGLSGFVDELINLNKEMDEYGALLTSARRDRDQLLYAEETGIYDRARGIKNYIRYITAGDDTRYKQVARIKFTQKRK